VHGTPVFSWADDSSEDGYQLWVYDALGKLVWQDLIVPSVKGNQAVTVTYAGPALQPGMIYKAESMKMGTPISATEDLKGVFLYAK
jgi:hypothetical protein